MIPRTACPACRGSGLNRPDRRGHVHPCRACNGTGHERMRLVSIASALAVAHIPSPPIDSDQATRAAAGGG
jgi:DnaJ-class molecular chaperone